MRTLALLGACVALLAGGAWLAERAYTSALARRCRGQASRPGTFELYAVGDSTPAGLVYGRELSFPSLVSKAFDDEIGGREIVVRNLAHGGDLIVAQEEALEHALLCRDPALPGALLVYAGHNDRFAQNALPLLESARRRWLYRSTLLRDLLVLAERAGALPRMRNGGTYEYHLRRVVDRALAAGLQPVLAAPVSNLADIDPGLSGHLPEEAARANAALDAGAALESRGRWRDAAALYAAPRPDERLDLRNYLEYRRAKCLQRLGDFQEAAAAFWRVVDRANNDSFGRAAPWQHEVVRAVARERGLEAVDAVTVFLRRSPHGVIGESLFIDGHHPNIAGTALLADAFADAVSRRFGAPVRRRFEGRLTEASLPVERRTAALNYAGRWLVNVAVGHVRPHLRLELAERRFRAAAALTPDDFSARMGLAVVEAAKHSDLLSSQRSAAWLARYPTPWAGRFAVPDDALPEVLGRLRGLGVPEPLLAEMRRAHAVR